MSLSPDDDAAPVPRGGITSLLSRLNVRAQDDADDRLDLRPGLSTATTEMTVVPPARPAEHGGSADERPVSEDAPTEADGASAGSAEAGTAETGSAEAGGAEAGRDPSPEGVRPERALPEREAAPPEGGRELPRRSARPKRSSVPSWDEIVFGTKGD